MRERETCVERKAMDMCGDQLKDGRVEGCLRFLVIYTSCVFR